MPISAKRLNEGGAPVADARGFDEFYAATAPRLVGQLFLLTRDMAEAQDCVQEAYSRAWQRWDRPHLGR
jgi:RNA polymerase sigma-70 factor, ECF subfamily